VASINLWELRYSAKVPNDPQTYTLDVLWLQDEEKEEKEEEEEGEEEEKEEEEEEEEEKEEEEKEKEEKKMKKETKKGKKKRKKMKKKKKKKRKKRKMKKKRKKEKMGKKKKGSPVIEPSLKVPFMESLAERRPTTTALFHSHIKVPGIRATHPPPLQIPHFPRVTVSKSRRCISIHPG
jgi:outer membrane biosynthesis protein TonB